MSQAPILVIDDSESVRREVQLALEAQGHKVLEAGDGAEALSVLQEYPDVRLALCDVHMPIMGGLEFLNQALVPGKFPDLKVVMLTTSGKPDLVRAAREAGASAWIVKPFQPEMLAATIRQVLAAA